MRGGSPDANGRMISMTFSRISIIESASSTSYKYLMVGSFSNTTSSSTSSIISGSGVIIFGFHFLITVLIGFSY